MPISINSEKNSEKSSEKSSEKNLEPKLALAVLETLPAAMLINNDSGRILWCNDRFAELADLPASDIRDKQRGDIMAATLAEVPEQSDTFHSNKGRQRAHWFRHHRLPLPGHYGSSSADVFLDIFLDISSEVELRQRFDELTDRIGQLTTIDNISGLLNQRSMMQNLEPLVSRSRRYENPLSLIAIELLNFNRLVERHGIESANKSVVAVSHLLKDQLRWADVIARISDSRIVIILPETEAADALNLAKKISSKVSEIALIDSNDIPMPLDTCYSVTSWKKGNDSRLLLNRAYHGLEKAIVKGSHSIVEE